MSTPKELAEKLIKTAEDTHPESWYVWHSNATTSNVTSLCNAYLELEGKLRVLQSASTAILENDQIECRGDEDCDHCVLLHALSEIEREE